MYAASTLGVLLLAAARSASAVGCATHTYGSCADGIVHWYDPDDGQICDPLDCGGGRAPPKTTNPCCTAAYTGTAVCVDTPSYMPCFTASSTSTATVVKTTTAAGATTTTTTEAGAEESAAVNGLSGYVESLTAATATGSEGSAATSAPTTTVTTGGTVNSTTTSGSSSAATVATNAAGYAQRHPFMALAGAAVGVVLL
ncbi:hypothetical protein BJ166DRAFT_91459 [Pestalotiopsis sp. NC0098]|nr:hypothetical protein BJ166DRAFT_91459 [Pestalotiopsis sp. NC0098]